MNKGNFDDLMKSFSENQNDLIKSLIRNRDGSHINISNNISSKDENDNKTKNDRPNELSLNELSLNELSLNKLEEDNCFENENELEENIKNPLIKFARWLSDAKNNKDIIEPTAMTLATCKDNIPSARVVLLKNTDFEKITFFTHYLGRKGEEIESNSNVAVVFWWGALGKQVRMEGTIKKTSRAISNEYFNTRSRDSCIGAWASLQSDTLTSRAHFLNQVSYCERVFKDFKKIPRPEHWGGYHIFPHRIEFWKQKPNRLHERIVYEKKGRIKKKMEKKLFISLNDFNFKIEIEIPRGIYCRF